MNRYPSSDLGKKPHAHVDSVCVCVRARGAANSQRNQIHYIDGQGGDTECGNEEDGKRNSSETDRQNQSKRVLKAENMPFRYSDNCDIR